MKFKPFEYPEIKLLAQKLLITVLNESGRGAVMIATAHVNEQLTKLIESTFPKDITDNSKKNLLNYPGHLSSFASKIELAYAFRLINKKLYSSLNSLRKIRNDAAHSSKQFELHELNEK